MDPEDSYNDVMIFNRLERAALVAAELAKRATENDELWRDFEGRRQVIEDMHVVVGSLVGVAAHLRRREQMGFLDGDSFRERVRARFIRRFGETTLRAREQEFSDA